MAPQKRQTKSMSMRKAPLRQRFSRPLASREQKSVARREAILAAALDEFSKRGFAAARLEDVAQRADVAKGTIYLHFADKEELFQELVRTMLGPLVANLLELSATDLPIRTVLERFVDVFVNGLFATRRREVAYLVISEGARFPKLAEFYYRQVIEPGMAAMRALLERAIKRGELPHQALAQFPQLVAAPGVLAIIWVGLFERFAHLDAAAMMRSHIDILLGQRSAS
jgi:AcrR family transcriptional regulator